MKKITKKNNNTETGKVFFLKNYCFGGIGS